jgi:hypothetical protein
LALKKTFAGLAKKIASGRIFLLQPFQTKNEFADLHEPDAKKTKNRMEVIRMAAKKKKGKKK